MIKLLLVDDHDFTRLGLSLYFSMCEDIQVIGEATHGQQAIDLYPSLRPDVVVMDHLMPLMDGLTATRILTRNYPDARILILTAGTATDQASALGAGAVDYLLKGVQADELADAVRKAFRAKRRQRSSTVPASLPSLCQ